MNAVSLLVFDVSTQRQFRIFVSSAEAGAVAAILQGAVRHIDPKWIVLEMSTLLEA